MMFDIDLFIYQVQNLRKERDDVYRKYCYDICEYCNNKVDCNPKTCEGYVSGNTVYLDGKPIESEWDCQDFEYGTCEMMEGTPCFQCFKKNYSGFQYRESEYDFDLALEQLKKLFSERDDIK